MESLIQMNKKGLTLIELLVGLVICAIVVAGIYRLFIAQGRAYTVQDQVVEVQQNIRSAMEIMLRDLRMAGFDDDRTPLVTIPQPPLVAGANSITVRYEYNKAPDPPISRECRYWLQNGTLLNLQETNNGVPGPTETILQNVQNLIFTYAVDEDDDGAMDDRDTNGNLVSPRATPVDDTDWLAAATVNARNLKVVGVRVVLTASPTQINPDVVQTVTPRMLVSAVTFRNLSLMR